MKKLLTLLIFAFATSSAFAVVNNQWKNMVENDPMVRSLSPELLNLGLQNFLTITPKDYRVKTGKRMGIVNAVKLKAAQKYVKKRLKKDGEDISEGVYILLAILGLGWVAMGLLDDWDGSDWIVNLILTALCWLPGLIHALVKKKNYY